MINLCNHLLDVFFNSNAVILYLQLGSQSLGVDSAGQGMLLMMHCCASHEINVGMQTAYMKQVG